MDGLIPLPPPPNRQSPRANCVGPKRRFPLSTAHYPLSCRITHAHTPCPPKETKKKERKREKASQPASQPVPCPHPTTPCPHALPPPHDHPEILPPVFLLVHSSPYAFLFFSFSFTFYLLPSAYLLLPTFHSRHSPTSVCTKWKKKVVNYVLLLHSPPYPLRPRVVCTSLFFSFLFFFLSPLFLLPSCLISQSQPRLSSPPPCPCYRVCLHRNVE